MPIGLDTLVNVDIGPWMKFTPELFKAIQAENAAMAGMTFGEAAASMGYKFVSGVGWVKNISITSEAVATGATATEAIAGAVATGGAESATGTIVLTETASGGAVAMGLGTIAKGAAAIALAGAGGYIIGNGIGEIIDYNFPDFFDGLFGSISQFLTGDERGLAFLFDADGHSYLPEASKEAITAYLENQISNNVDYNYVNCDGTNVLFTTIQLGDCWTFEAHPNGGRLVNKIEEIVSTSPIYRIAFYNSASGNNVDEYFISKNTYTITTQQYRVNQNNVFTSSGSWYRSTLDADLPQTIDGHTWYGLMTTYASIGEVTLYKPPGPALINSIEIKDRNEFQRLLTNAQLNILFGKQLSGSKIPKINKYELPSKPKIKVNPDSETESESWIRIPLPEPSDDPEALPVISPILEPEDKPETEKLPKPLPQPEPQGTATPSPDVDPSTEPEPVTPQPPTPTPKPSDSGITPEPPIPVIPPLSSSATGLLHVYNPTIEQVNEFGSWLWTTFSGDLIDTIAKLFNNPMDAVIGLHELYCTPTTGDTTTIKAGFLDSGVASRLVTQRYTEINCGAITVPEYWGNYLDYAPYTKVYCYLPFIGIVELNTDDIIGHGVQVLYKIDSYNGSCIAMIITAKDSNSQAVKYQFSGNCAVEVPITSGMKSAIQTALIGAATAAIGAGAAGVSNVGMLTAAGVNGAAQHGLKSKNSVAHSGSFGSSYGAMGIKKPYFIVRRPIQKVVKNYNKKYGYPAHSMVNIGSCSGYLRCRDFDVQSSTATEEEKKRIEVLLKEGVYV